jgi:predicted TIM-barrel fold metal-dependent hydrolase
MMPPFITLEEHFVSEFVDQSETGLDPFPPSIRRKIRDLGEERLQDMRDGGVSLQIISHVPGPGWSLKTCRQINDQLSKATMESGCRFGGFAALPILDPVLAATELSRCVQELKFVGALIPNHANGRFFDDEFFWPIFERAQELDIPIYLHPAFPSATRKPFFEGNFNDAAAVAMSAYVWDWHASVGLHFFRLFASGLFDKYPRLKLIFGHMGEMIPFMIDRAERYVPRWGPRNRGIRTVWDENIWITTSGIFTLGPFACLLRTTRMERILYSVDYPLEDNKDGRAFFEAVESSGLLNEEDLKMFAYGNAERLLKIKLKV